ncbi:acetate--CoA ligase family protein [Rhodococcus sp. T2V]|uniref:acetate--CoA ligase family protein n=1 Tax=Rhodococcus sp. T2V TaxID=3034164 RepID=UPI0023E1915A|nr:acetate--CoA ligase family protein [Rhodococcus sp. T2V]MDF3312219.1 acetate--CoA ligase family protein [Rhodococcus sp. T2V]
MAIDVSEIKQGEGFRPAHRLKRLFAPRSVALIGASDRSNWSKPIHHALTVYGFTGQLYYVNPRGGTAHGQKLWTSLSALPEVPDLVFVMVPAHAVPGIVAEAAALGVGAVEVLSSGFSEEGPEGAALQERLATVSRESDIPVLGPNNLGFVNVHERIGLFPMAESEPLPAGSVAMVSQSGNLASQVQTLARTFDVGLSFVVSTGNEVDVTVGDVIDYLVDDESTAAIGVFLEMVRHPERFLAACRRARQAGKLVVVLKAGRSEAAARSALAHTGSLVGDDAIIGAALEAAGAVRVDTLEDLVAVADVFTRIGEIPGTRVGLVSISGGAGDIASDLAEQLGLTLPDLSSATKEVLTDILPSYGTPQNPLDMTGLVVPKPEIFGQGVAAVASDESIDVVIAVTEAEHTAADLNDGMLAGLLVAANSAPRPTLLATTTVRPVAPSTAGLRAEGATPGVSYGLDRVLTSISAIADWTKGEGTLREENARHLEFSDIGPSQGTWSERRSRELLERAGVPVVPVVFVRPGEELPTQPEGLYAIKIVSDEILHKSEVGGVKLNIDAADLPAAVREILDTVAANAPGVNLEGVLVSPMRSGGVELLVGAVRDPDWGCVLAVALGGIWTEVLADVQRIALPADAGSIRRAIERLRGFPLLDGARGSVPADLNSLVSIVSAVGELAVALGPNLAALEVNPLRVDGTTIEALDAAVIWND